MSEVLKSKGIICFFVFIIFIGIVSSNSLNSMKNDSSLNNVVVLNK